MLSTLHNSGVTSTCMSCGQVRSAWASARGCVSDDAFLVDIRQQAHYSGKSINLALSVRGIEALKAAGVESSVRSDSHARAMGVWA